MVCDLRETGILRGYYSGLNPTFSGIWSATSMQTGFVWKSGAVLILLFLEYGLRQRIKKQIPKIIRGLNPTFSGIWSATPYCASLERFATLSLNPTFSGIWSATPEEEVLEGDKYLS